MQSRDSDEATITKLHADFAAAWSKGDVDGLIALFAEDSVRVGARGDVQRGRDEIRAAFVTLFGGPLAGARLTMGDVAVRFLGAEAAIKQGPFEIDPGGGAAVLRGYSIDVMIKADGTWLILETHPMLFPPS